MAVAAADWKVFDMQIARVLLRVKAQSSKQALLPLPNPE